EREGEHAGGPRLPLEGRTRSDQPVAGAGPGSEGSPLARPGRQTARSGFGQAAAGASVDPAHDRPDLFRDGGLSRGPAAPEAGPGSAAPRAWRAGPRNPDDDAQPGTLPVLVEPV